MTDWSATELQTIADADEVGITTRRADGSLRPAVPIWVVRVGDAIYIRSYRGADGGWYRHGNHDRVGTITVAGLARDVAFQRRPDDTIHPASHDTAEQMDQQIDEQIDRAYRDKYPSYGPTYLTPMLAPAARMATLRVLPHTTSAPPHQGVSA